MREHQALALENDMSTGVPRYTITWYNRAVTPAVRYGLSEQDDPLSPANPFNSNDEVRTRDLATRDAK